MRETATVAVSEIDGSRPASNRVPDLDRELSSTPSDPASRQRAMTLIVCAILAVALVKQLVLVVAYPPFQGHDEVAHLGYLSTVAEDGRIPTFSDRLPEEMEPYSRYTLDWPALYTANHPVLYYVTALPFYWFAPDDLEGQLYAVRLAAVPFFLLTVWLTYLIARALFPNRAAVILGATAIVAFQPQLGFEGAIINNDMLAIALGTLILYLCIRALRDGLTIRLAVAIGITCGIGLLTKATLTALLPVVAGVAIWLRWPRPWEQLRQRRWLTGTALRAAAIIVPTVVLALPWYLYLRRTYGDFTAFEATRQLQSDWNRPAGSFTELLFSRSFHEERVHETWGYYGWRMIPLETSQLAVVYVAMALALVGAVVGVIRWLTTRDRDDAGHIRPFEQFQVAGILAIVTASVLMYGAMVYFGTMFLLTQARYFFPIVPAAIVLATAGLVALVPERGQRVAAIALVAGAGLFQTVILVKQVLPYAYL
jgi:4-amino-4-deoxy-L-arabinose transferase-like glycosyltransferase